MFDNIPPDEIEDIKPERKCWICGKPGCDIWIGTRLATPNGEEMGCWKSVPVHDECYTNGEMAGWFPRTDKAELETPTSFEACWLCGSTYCDYYTVVTWDVPGGKTVPEHKVPVHNSCYMAT